jgi:hypothetical protein
MDMSGVRTKAWLQNYKLTSLQVSYFKRFFIICVLNLYRSHLLGVSTVVILSVMVTTKRSEMCKLTTTCADVETWFPRMHCLLKWIGCQIKDGRWQTGDQYLPQRLKPTRVLEIGAVHCLVVLLCVSTPQTTRKAQRRPRNQRCWPLFRRCPDWTSLFSSVSKASSGI